MYYKLDQLAYSMTPPHKAATAPFSNAGFYTKDFTPVLSNTVQKTSGLPIAIHNVCRKIEILAGRQHQ
jgi:hypothetical protein